VKLNQILRYNKYLREANADLNSSGIPNSPKAERRGRKKADYDTIQREAKLAADWKRARERGILKSKFARDSGTTVAEFDKFLDRVSKRKSRSDK
jgi:hypothetical protein